MFLLVIALANVTFLGGPFIEKNLVPNYLDYRNYLHEKALHV